VDIVKVLKAERSRLMDQIVAIDRAVSVLNGRTVRRSPRRRAVRIWHKHSLAVRRKIGRGVKAAHRRRNGNKEE
jgi:hypothetical protein